MSAEQTRELLNRAAERLRTKGWVQNMSQDGDGRCCLFGALYVESDWKTIEGGHVYLDAACAVQLSIDALPFSRRSMVEGEAQPVNVRRVAGFAGETSARWWNDRVAQRVEEVIAVLTTTAGLPDDQLDGRPRVDLNEQFREET